MSEKELQQARVFGQLKDRQVTQKEAAQKLQLSDRWVREKQKRYLAQGEKGLVHKSRGRASPRKVKQEHVELIVSLLRGEWLDFGPTYAAQKLEQVHSIKMSAETLRQIMIRHGIWQAERVKVKHRKRRDRKPMIGVMIQLDGSPHDWFEGRAPWCTLIVFIDDATSKILWLEFAPSESVIALMQATKHYVEKNGIPHTFYTDHGGVFHVNLNNKEGDKKTQWEEACARIGTKVSHAHSPQAKGRVERCNQTLQDRLVKELRLAGVSSIQEANEFLVTSSFIQDHNDRFGVDAMKAGDAHMPLANHNLDVIFTINEKRVMAQDFTITYQKRVFQLTRNQNAVIRPKDIIIVKTHLNGDISLWIRNIRLNFTELSARPTPPAKPEKPVHIRTKPTHINSQRWVTGLPPLESRVKPAQPAVEATSS